MTEVIAILFLATFVEGLVQYLFAEEGVSQPWLRYVALIFGIVLSVSYMIDIPSMIGLSAGYAWVNWIVSGIIIGRGSNYVNDVMSSIKRA